MLDEYAACSTKMLMQMQMPYVNRLVVDSLGFT